MFFFIGVTLALLGAGCAERTPLSIQSPRAVQTAPISNKNDDPFYLELNENIPSEGDQALYRINVRNGEATPILKSVRATFSSLPPGVVLQLISSPSGSGAAYFAGHPFEAQTAAPMPIYRFNLATKQFTELTHKTVGGGKRFAVSPDGHYLALFQAPPGTNEADLNKSTEVAVLNLDTDIAVTVIPAGRDAKFCDVESEISDEPAEISWPDDTNIRVKKCTGTSATGLRSAGVEIKNIAKDKIH